MLSDLSFLAKHLAILIVNCYVNHFVTLNIWIVSCTVEMTTASLNALITAQNVFTVSIFVSFDFQCIIYHMFSMSM